MKIAIYGDSYANMTAHDRNLNKDLSWFELFDNKYNIDNFSAGGSSLIYSYLQFLKHQEKYDKNIVLGSLPSRIYVPNLKEPHCNNFINYFPERWTSKGVSKEEINSVLLFYKHIYDPEQEEEIRKLIEKEIKSYKNTLYISIPETLEKVTIQERLLFEFDPVKTPLIENMNCHMSNDSNQVLYDLICKWVKTGEFNFRIEDFKLPDKKDKYKYFIHKNKI